MKPRLPRQTFLAALFLGCAGATFGAEQVEPLRDVEAVPREVAGAAEIARLDGDARLERILLVLPQRDQQTLARLLASQQDPASPEYRRWLLPSEFEKRFGAQDGDVAAVTAWLTGHGLEVENVPPGRAALVFSGRARDVESAFDTELHELLYEGRVRIANVRPARLPASLARRVSGILGLHSFSRRHPLARRAPALTSGGRHYLAPADFTAIYDVDPLLASGIDGRGRTIGLLAETNVNVSDTTYFRQYFGLPANDPSVVLNGADPGRVSGDEMESDIDLQWAGAVAPGARILLVVSQSTSTAYGVDLSALYAVSANVADVLSMSYGACELDFGDSDTVLYSNAWAQAAAQGISVLVSSGDGGAAGCDPSGSNAGSASVNGLCSSPYATCVGGTGFTDNSSTYWSETNDGTTKKSVKSYVPETTWSLSGGGKSILFSRPAWQNVAAGLPADGARYVPDVSVAASTATPYAFVLGHTTVSSGLNLNYAGTSFSAPAFAGIAALLSQRAGSRLGNLNPLLYALGAAQYGTAGAPVSGSGPFHDVTSGTNTVPGVTGYDAGPGYDAVTGLGSPDVSALAAALASPSASGVDFAISAQPAVVSLAAGSAASITVSLAQAAAAADVVAALSVTGLPAGLTVSFSPSTLTDSTSGILSRAEQAVLTLTASASVAAGTYRLDLAATAGAVTRHVALFVTVGTQAAVAPSGPGVQAPVVLDIFGKGGSHYTSDLVAVNRGNGDATLLLRFAPTPAPASPGPVVARSLGAGRQLYVPDVIAFLNANGYSLPAGGAIGTLFATFVGATDPLAVYVGSRTSTPNPNTSVGGSFGTFSAAVATGGATSGDAWIYGLRENLQFRSNLALVHAPGAATGVASGPVTLEVQIYDGDSGAPVGAPLVQTLQPGQFSQINSVLQSTPVLAQLGVSNGYARVHLTSGIDRFIAYGVVNDGGSAGGGTSDGSFIPANATGGLVPIVLDLPGSTHYSSDLTLTNPTSSPVTVTLAYTAAVVAPFSGLGSGTRTVTLPVRQQLVVPNAIAFLRGLGLPIPADGGQGGTLLVSGAPALARTSNPNPDVSVGGTFGLAYPAVAPAARATGEAWVYGLRQDADARTNLAVADARAADPAGVEYTVDVFDSDSGAVSPVLTKKVTLTGGQWTQFNTILAEAGISHGYARVKPTSGTSDFVVYGVVNDGPTAGSRTSDGSYVPMVVVR